MNHDNLKDEYRIVHVERETVTSDREPNTKVTFEMNVPIDTIPIEVIVPSNRIDEIDTTKIYTFDEVFSFPNIPVFGVDIGKGDSTGVESITFVDKAPHGVPFIDYCGPNAEIQTTVDIDKLKEVLSSIEVPEERVIVCSLDALQNMSSLIQPVLTSFYDDIDVGCMGYISGLKVYGSVNIKSMHFSLMTRSEYEEFREKEVEAFNQKMNNCKSKS